MPEVGLFSFHKTKSIFCEYVCLVIEGVSSPDKQSLSELQQTQSIHISLIKKQLLLTLSKPVLVSAQELFEG
jgi:hypothetical protein